MVLIRFFGVKFADPREFVESPCSWLNLNKKSIYINDHDYYISAKMAWKNEILCLESVIQPVFYLDDFYHQFSSFNGLSVYVFPDAEILYSQVETDFLLFEKFHKEKNQKFSTVFNTFHTPKSNKTIDIKKAEQLLNIKIDRETYLGHRIDVNQKQSFHDLISDIYQPPKHPVNTQEENKR